MDVLFHGDGGQILAVRLEVSGIPYLFRQPRSRRKARTYEHIFVRYVRVVLNGLD